MTFLDGRTFEASVVGGDEWCDVAVLKLQDSDSGKLRATGFKPIKLGSSSDLRLGDTVIALGHPLGLKFAATSGIVSSNTKLPGDDLLFQRRRLPPECVGASCDTVVTHLRCTCDTVVMHLSPHHAPPPLPLSPVFAPAEQWMGVRAALQARALQLLFSAQRGHDAAGTLSPAMPPPVPRACCDVPVHGELTPCVGGGYFVPRIAARRTRSWCLATPAAR